MEITLPKRHVKHDQIFAYMGGIIRNWRANWMPSPKRS